MRPLILLLPTAVALSLVLGNLASCGADKEPTPAAKEVVLEHDFGTIPHGHVVDHVFKIPVPSWHREIVPVAWQGECACARGQLFLRDANGDSRRLQPGQSRLFYQLQKGDSLELRLTLDTNLKEPVSAPSKLSVGKVVFQPLDGGMPPDIPVAHVRFHFAIHAPVRVTPTPVLNFGNLAICRNYRQELTLYDDHPGLDVQLGTVRVDNPDVTVKLDRQQLPAKLQVEYRPNAAVLAQAVTGNTAAVRQIIRVATNIPGQRQEYGNYELIVELTGSVTPTVVTSPPSQFSFGMFRFDSQRERFLIVTDHDHKREADFVVLGIQDKSGANMADYFSTEFESLGPRRRRLVLSYRGNFSGTNFSGELLLGKRIGGKPVIRIPFRGYNKTGS